MVMEAPLYWTAALFATRLENKGESAMTTILQKTKKLMSAVGEAIPNTKGDTKQQSADIVKA